MSGRPVPARRPHRAWPRDKKVAAHGAPSRISPARQAAFGILLRVAESDAHSDDLLHSNNAASLSLEDRNLATALVMGVLRWQIALDKQIGKLLARAGQKLAEPVAITLRMGALQLLHMDRIPAHAAINEGVELCRAAGQAHAAGMVNAVLRKVAAQAQVEKALHLDAARRQPLFEATPAFAERLGHPAWLVERWVGNYGRKNSLAICKYDQREPAVADMFLKPLVASSGEGASLPASAVQIDDGSRLVAELAAQSIPRAGSGICIWDCCAAPGGKTLVLAERLASAEILATDISAKRLARMEDRVRKTSYTNRIRCAVADTAKSEQATIFAKGTGWTHFDLVLCDAPCSGTGTLARNPEIRHRLRPGDLARQATRQQAILRGALSRLAPGGRLLYSTCSLEPEENERVVEATLAELPDIRRKPLALVLQELATSGVLDADSAAMLARTAMRDGCLRTIPGIHPCDGFFAALLERAN